MKDEAIKSLKSLFKQLKLKANIKFCKEENSFLIFDISLEPGGTFKKLERCSTEIALAVRAISEPLIYPITKEGVVRMEIMISEQETVEFSETVNGEEFITSEAIIPLALGEMRNGDSLIADLTEMPHLLVSGATGSGKSIMLQCIINSILLGNTPVNLALIDPKRVEFSYYNNLYNLFGPIAKNTESSINLLQDLIGEMEHRFRKLEKAGARNISEYKRKMPYIVMVIDELADLMMPSKKDVQELICTLAQKSRACGIHLVAATQRPSVDIITGLIKTNFPARISCKVSEAVDSRIILDKNGAERLTGKGDAIIDCSEYSFKRFKGALIEEREIQINVNQKKNWWRRLWRC